LAFNCLIYFVAIFSNKSKLQPRTAQMGWEQEQKTKFLLYAKGLKDSANVRSGWNRKDTVKELRQQGKTG